MSFINGNGRAVTLYNAQINATNYSHVEAIEYKNTGTTAVTGTTIAGFNYLPSGNLKVNTISLPNKKLGRFIIRAW